MTSPSPLPDPVTPAAIPEPVGTEVQTESGWIRGVLEDGMLVWRGVPYAAPPVGDLRFRAPTPMPRWAGFREADKDGPVAPQAISGSAAGAGLRTRQSEDCLTLTVTSRAAAPSGPRPVLVWIHGGAYIMGSASSWLYDGREIARDGDAVVVTINYRLGALGYIDVSAYGDQRRPFESNLGLRDQIAALRWVRDNIAAFGGDPDNVTIFGESAGAMAVTTLLATPAAHGLFHRAIAQSPAPALVNTAERAEEIGRRFVEVLRAKAGRKAPASDAELLTTASVRTIRRAQSHFVRRVSRSFPAVSTMTCVIDGDLLPVHPLAAFSNGTTAAVPTIFGTNLDEGTLFYLLRMPPTRPDELEEVFAVSDPQARDRIVAQYPGYPGRDAAIDLAGDLTFWAPTVRCAEGQSRQAPTWMYRFDYSTKGLRMARLRAMHAVEIPGLFGTSKGLFLRALTFGGRRTMLKAGRRMRAHWLSMARTGEPGSGWPAYDEKSRQTLIFDAKDRVESDPNQAQREAWEGYRYGG